MKSTLCLVAIACLVGACLSGCGVATGPAGVPSSTDVNPITGSRGGSATSR